eukprot:scaffold7052_cov254-Pinguiococcus_pyrenoidosus.AAC.36
MSAPRPRIDVRRSSTWRMLVETEPFSSAENPSKNDDGCEDSLRGVGLSGGWLRRHPPRPSLPARRGPSWRPKRTSFRQPFARGTKCRSLRAPVHQETDT